MDSTRSKILKRICMVLFLAAYVFLIYYCATKTDNTEGIFVRRVEVITFAFAFLELHCFFEIPKIYDFIFRNRVVLSAAIVIFLVANNFNGSSLGIWDDVIQPDTQLEYGSPVIGHSQLIRSDEWNVNVPRMISGSYSNYSKYNDLVRGTKTDNISASGLYRDYSALYNPSNWGFYLFNFSHGLSFKWSYLFVFGFLFSFEFFYILTKNRSLSVLGGAVLWFSPFNAWWSLSIPLLSLVAIPTLFYYMLTGKNKKYRAIFAFMLAIAGADFCCNLYPAWQVPVGWIVLTLMIYFVVQNKDWKKYKITDWMIIILALAFMISIILRFVIVDMSYIKAIARTTYPGKRVDYGGNFINKLLGYLASYSAGISSAELYPNNCETATFWGAFPLGYMLIPVMYILYKVNKEHSSESRSRIRLITFLLFPLVLLTLYCTTGLPQVIAKITLLSSCTRFRSVDFLGALLVIITIVIIAEIRSTGGINALIAVVMSGLSVMVAYKYGKSIVSFDDTHMIEVAAVIFFVGTVILLSGYKKINFRYFFFIYAIIVSIGGIAVNPVQVGTGPLTGKPVAKKIRKIVKKDDDAKWAASDSVISQYLIANGASTYTSVNYIPNMKLWKKIDDDGVYREYYNRYAHLYMTLSDTDDTKIELLAADAINLTINKDYYEKLGVKYFVSMESIPDDWDDEMKMIYHKDNIWIYRTRNN